jgi:hypothetical protein
LQLRKGQGAKFRLIFEFAQIPSVGVNVGHSGEFWIYFYPSRGGLPSEFSRVGWGESQLDRRWGEL